jgi:hypothetical protein
MDALSFLRADHQSVLGMFEVLDGASTEPAPSKADWRQWSQTL